MAQESNSLKSLEKVIYKCGQCRFLNGEKKSIGYGCTNPARTWRSNTAMYHQKSTKACKMFQIKAIEIPMKLPSLNEYINVCRFNKFKASKFKKNLENDIAYYLQGVPRYTKPIKIHFHWVEGNKKRDLDNVAYAKKHILDAMVKAGILKDDNRRCVVAFSDTFEYGKETKVIIDIEEVQDGYIEEL